MGTGSGGLVLVPLVGAGGAGAVVGATVGSGAGSVGSSVGAGSVGAGSVGSSVGASVGSSVGSSVGAWVGSSVVVGTSEGEPTASHRAETAGRTSSVYISQLTRFHDSMQEGEGRKGHTQGNVGTAGIEDAAGGSTLDGVELGADAGVVVDGAVGLALDGVVKAGDGALGDVLEGLGAGQGGGEDGGVSVLHFEKMFWVLV